MEKREKTMNLNETIFGSSYLVAKSEYVDGKHRVKNITLMDYMKELGFIDHSGPVETLSVVWHYDKEGDMYITQIYDHDTGEIYWDEPSDEMWTENDDEITNALLMYGNLESVVGECY